MTPKTKTLYEAANSLEAHMILDLIEQQGLRGRIDGEFLQGGIGELPAAGLVRVIVAEQDYPAARQIVESWEAAHGGPEPAAAPAVSPARKTRTWQMFAAGLALGILASYAYFRTPLQSNGLDYNHDGKLDEEWIVSPSGRQLRTEIDRNLDGNVDFVFVYGRDGSVEMSEGDDDFDGSFEWRTAFLRGNPHLAEADTDGDGYRDFRTNYRDGVLHSNEYILPATGMAQKIEYFRLGRLRYSEMDTDRDGRMDKRTRYGPLGEAVSSEDID